MSTLTVWKFASWDGANQAIATLEALAKQDLIKIHDAASVSWQPEKLGTSALFLMTSDVVQDKVKATFEATGLRRPQLIQSNLSSEQEAALREMFAG